MADDITPLRGEGRTVGRITGLWGELMAEFLGVFVLISFGDGVVAVAVAGLPGSGRTSGPTTIFDAAATSHCNGRSMPKRSIAVCMKRVRTQCSPLSGI